MPAESSAGPSSDLLILNLYSEIDLAATRESLLKAEVGTLRERTRDLAKQVSYEKARADRLQSSADALLAENERLRAELTEAGVALGQSGVYIERTRAENENLKNLETIVREHIGNRDLAYHLTNWLLNAPVHS